MDFTKQTVLVTGANRGIGLSIAETFLNAGIARLYAAVRDPQSAQSLVDKFRGRVVAIELDLSKPQTIAAAAQAASDVTVVVNNAGVLSPGDAFSDELFDNYEFEFGVNVKGLLHMARTFAPVLKRNGGGAFVQLNSVASLKNFADFTTYCASKAAAYSITQGLRDKLADQGTQVVSVHPGPIGTDMAVQAGMTETDPPSVVADGILDALRTGAFHVFPDRMAKQFWQSYEGFAKAVVEPAMAEA